jgi:hypothetical protein
MDFLKDLFGAEKLSFEEFSAKVNEKKFDIADLATGNYVDKKKHDRIAGERDMLKTKTAELEAKLKEAMEKGVGDDALKKQIEQLQNDLKAKTTELEGVSLKLTKRDRQDYALKKMGGDIRLAKLLAMEASELVTEDVDFETAVEKIIKDNADVYTVKKDEEETDSATVKTIGSSSNKTPKDQKKHEADFRAALGLPPKE